jgi:AAA domain
MQKETYTAEREWTDEERAANKQRLEESNGDMRVFVANGGNLEMIEKTNQETRRTELNGDEPDDWGSTLQIKSANEVALAGVSISQVKQLLFFEDDGYALVGRSHLLSGKPKVGKTELLLDLTKEWTGYKILWITEEAEDDWGTRLSGQKWDNLDLLFGYGHSSKDLLEIAIKGDHHIVVVDTLRGLLEIQNENDNSELARILKPWIGRHRSAGKTLFMVHHNRKGAGSDGDAIAGGNALAGSFDRILEVTKEGDLPDNYRLIRSRGRLLPDKTSVYGLNQLPLRSTQERETQRKFILIGERSFVAHEEARGEVVSLLTLRPLTTKEIRDQLGDKHSIDLIEKVLKELANLGIARRDPPMSLSNVRGKRVVWWNPTYNVSSERQHVSEVIKEQLPLETPFLRVAEVEVEVPLPLSEPSKYPVKESRPWKSMNSGPSKPEEQADLGIEPASASEYPDNWSSQLGRVLRPEEL